eukprot:scaffold3069_cov215-Amphora_coffeaeformis.AAC.30
MEIRWARKIDFPKDDTKVGMLMFHATGSSTSHGLDAFEWNALGGKALGDFELRELQPVTSIGDMGRSSQHFLHQWRFGLFAKFQLCQGIVECQFGRQLAHQIETPRRVTNILFITNARAHLAQAFGYQAWFKFGMRSHVKRNHLSTVFRRDDLGPRKGGRAHRRQIARRRQWRRPGRCAHGSHGGTPSSRQGDASIFKYII